MKRRVISAILSILLIFSLIPTSFAEDIPQETASQQVSEEPAATVTPSPSEEQTLEPTVEPTQTPEATDEPAPEQTLEPTVKPTAELTPEPTVEPAPEPSIQSGFIMQTEPIFSGGDGTEASPFGISTPEQLNAVRDYPTACFILLKDIDMTEATSAGGAYYDNGNGWLPICTSSAPFLGSFNGNGKKIYGININRGIAGLFGYIGKDTDTGATGRIYNLSVNGNYKATFYGGILVGYSKGNIENISTSGSVVCLTQGDAAGIAGYNSGTIEKSGNKATITAANSSSGIANDNYGTIRLCWNTGGVKGCTGSGGITNRNSGTIENCFNTGYVCDYNGVGGLSEDNRGTITDCYNLGGVQCSQPGGLVKTNSGTVRNCFWLDTVSTGVVTGNSTVYGSHALSVNGLTNASSFSSFDFNTVWTMTGDASYHYPELTDNPLALSENTTDFAGGRGLPTDPYEISTPAHLNNVRNYLGSWFILVNDIDLSAATRVGGDFYNNGSGWQPIGDTTMFLGGFNGNGHVIKGLNLNSTATTGAKGLFSYTGTGARIENLGMAETVINATEIVAGSIAGYNYGSISKCYNDGYVNASYAGGIAGSNSGNIINCYNTGTVFGWDVGGISEKNFGLIQYAYNAGSVVSKDKDAGAIVNENYGAVKDCRYLDVSTKAIGSGTGTVTNVSSISEEQMRYSGYFASFDFSNVWTMGGEGVYPYPELKTMLPSIAPENTSEFHGGNGCAYSPYQITTAEQLYNIRNYPDAFYILNNDIDLTAATQEGGAYYNGGKGWDPIENFMGCLDGNHHTITGLTVNRPQESDAGLFANSYYGSSSVKDLKLLNIRVTGHDYIGGLIGESGSLFYNIEASGTVSDADGYSGFAYVGGLAGKSTGPMTLCRNECAVTGYESGGIAGKSYGTIRLSCNAGTVAGMSACGGITAENRCDIYDCYNNGEVKGIYGTSGCKLGGIAGDIRAGSFHECYNTGHVHNGSGGNLGGGILGDCTYFSPAVTNCYYINTNTEGVSYGNVTGTVSKSDAELKQQINFQGFDFENTWVMDTSPEYGYPVLSGMSENTACTVTFDLNGKAGTPPGQQALSYGDKLIKPEDPVYTGFTFQGWYKGSDCIVPWNFENDTLNRSITLYALWTPDSCTVTFNSMNGSDVEPQTLQYGEKITKPEDPIKGGYIFEGWYEDTAYSNTWDFNSDGITSNITLYAKWTEDVAPFTGSGTVENPYGISTPGQLNNVRNYADACFVLLNDIDMTSVTAMGGEFYNNGLGWVPIAPFSGTFDGAGHKIIGLKINRTSESCLGLFNVISSGGVVKRLGMVDCDICGGSAGSICGIDYGTIELCYNTGKVTGSNVGGTGGIASEVSGGLISKCWNSGTVDFYSASDSSAPSFGGIAGSACSSSGIAISDCYNTGIVKGTNDIGGIAGDCNTGIRNCYSLNSSGYALIARPYGKNMDCKGLYFFNTSNYRKGSAENVFAKNVVYGTALNNDEMQDVDSFTGYDFDTVWTMAGNALYPYPEIKDLPQIDIKENTLDFAKGNGFPYNPFEVGTPEELNNVRKYPWASFKLTNDIDMTPVTNEGGTYYNNGQGFEPIGFYGVFDGAGFDIKGLKISRNDSFAGLFTTGSARIENLGVTGAEIYGSEAGGIVAHGGDTEITHCHFSGKVAASMYAGGIAGNISGGGIHYCNNNAQVSGYAAGGGIAGEIENSEMGMCFNTGSIESNYSCGGIVGSDGKSLISDCYNRGTILDGCGIAGDITYSGSVARCYNAGYVKVPIAPSNEGNGITDCFYLYNGGATIKGALAKTDEELCQQETYAGFDFNGIWTMTGNANYHYAELLGMPDTTIPREGCINFEGGDGTEANPYQISSPSQLNEIRYYPLKHFVLKNDIDMSAATSVGGDYYNHGLGWEPVGSGNSPFLGVFDGNGYTISGLVINCSYDPNRDENNTGLFGAIDWGAQIKNLQMTKGNIIGAGNSGGIAAFISQSAAVKNCSFSGCVISTRTYNTGDVSVGGIAGSCNGEISCCYNSGEISSTGYSGGICGDIDFGEINNCYNTGFIKGTKGSAGIAGVSSAAHITDCYNIGNIYGGNAIIGYGMFSGNTLENCYYTEKDISGAYSSDTLQNVTIKTAEELQQQNSFTGFDFDTIWTMGGNASYPCPELRYMPQENIPENTTDYNGGNGLIYNPYKISTPQNLYHVRDNLAAWYVLNNDIDISDTVGQNGEYYNDGQGWNPIGDQNTPFAGVFDGKGHKILGLYINRPQTSNIGLIGYTGRPAQIHNLEVDGDVTGYQYISVIIGYNQGIITNCKSGGNITGSGAGGITGLSANYISQCSNSANISGSGTIGGICGENGTSNNFIKCVVTDSYNTGSISGVVGIGGIVGDNSYGNITACFNKGLISASNNSAGGVAGSSYYGTISKCYNSGKISGQYPASVGGIAGTTYSGSITDCFNIEELNGCRGTIIGTINLSTVISDCYSVSPNCYLPYGQIGIYPNQVINIYNYYYLYEGSNTDPRAKTREQMCSQTTFAGFDFTNTWEIVEGERFPVLKGVPFTYTSGINIDKDALSINKGDSFNLTANLSPNDVTNKNVNWRSSDIGIALVTNGIVKAVSPGTAVITAESQDGAFTDTCGVTVEPKHVTSLTISGNPASANKGDTFTLSATVLPSDATYPEVKWSSNNENVATVDQSGKVTAAGVGNATIMAKAEDKFNTCEIVVSPRQYTVKFDYNLAVSASEVTVHEGSTLSKPDIPENTGYILDGWYTDNATFEQQWDFNNSVATNMTLYAKWSTIIYSITYELNGGTASNPGSYTVNDAFIINNPSKQGYNFAGWTGTGLSTAVMSLTIPAGSTGNKAYTANWTLVSYSLSYGLSGGIASNPLSYTIYDTITLNNPLMQGFNFVGWTGTGISVPTMNVTIPAGSTGNKYYYANWKLQRRSSDLSGAYVSIGSLSPEFSKTRTSYSINLDEYTDSVTITPVKEFDGAKMTINKLAVTSFKVSLANGKSTTVSVKVTLGSSSRTYTFNVKRAKSSNNNLGSLSASAGTWSKTFDKNILNYTLSLDEFTKSTKITDRVAAPGLSKVSASSNVSLSNGQSKVVKIMVTAQSGAKKTYVVTVQRAPSTDTSLTYLKTNSGAIPLCPVFSVGNTSYTMTLPADKASVKLYAKAHGYKAAIYFDGAKRMSKTVTLQPGKSVLVNVTVVAQSGDTRTFTLNVTRLIPSNSVFK